MDTDKTKETLNQIEEFLRATIEKLEPIQKDPVGRGRPRILPATCLWSSVIVCVLHGWNSQLAMWRLLTQKGLWDYPRFAISDQAIYNRLEKDGSQPFKRLFEQVSAVLKERLTPYGQRLAEFASEVVALDNTTLDKVTRHLPLLRGVADGDRQLLPGRLAGVFDVRLQQWRHVIHVDDPNQNEKVTARTLFRTHTTRCLDFCRYGLFWFFLVR